MAAANIDARTAGQESYGSVAKILHWCVAGAIVLQFVLAKLADGAESRFREFVLIANHKSVGISILVVALLRLAWRLAVPPPAPLPMPAWQRAASAVSHSALYALVILMPLTGWLMSSAANVPVSWFNLFQLPDLVAADEPLAALFENTHETMAKLLLLVASIHVAAALKHALVDRDRALRRIVSPAALLLAVLIVAVGLVVLTPASRADDGLPAAWRIDYEDSYIRFQAEQAGARFEGEWTQWNADIRFGPAAPDAALFDVEVDVTGVETGDRDRDETLADPEFFDAGKHPAVAWQANEVTATDDGFVAAGTITVKGRQFRAPLEFRVSAEGERRLLTGSARLDRLELGIGTGEWSDTAWLGRYVDVSVRVAASVD